MKNIALISLSNGLKIENKEIIDNIISTLDDYNIIESNVIYEKSNHNSYDGKTKALELMKLYKDKNVEAIFDVSGGDLANETLEYIDFQVIKDNPKPFFGYSDLSVIMNSIYSQTKAKSYWFQLRNIIYDKSKTTFKNIDKYLKRSEDDIFNFSYKWVQGEKMEGTLIGGNLRCTLKLAGTKFMPSFHDKLILLESYGGDEKKIRTYLTQCKIMGMFKEGKGLILGTFTELEKETSSEYVENLVKEIINNPDFPIIKTSEIGHSPLSKSIIIGGYYKFSH